MQWMVSRMLKFLKIVTSRVAIVMLEDDLATFKAAHKQLNEYASENGLESHTTNVRE